MFGQSAGALLVLVLATGLVDDDTGRGPDEDVACLAEATAALPGDEAAVESEAAKGGDGAPAATLESCKHDLAAF